MHVIIGYDEKLEIELCTYAANRENYIYNIIFN